MKSIFKAKKGQLLSFLILALPVIVSGCLGGGDDSGIETSQTDGVVISSFQPDLSEVEERTPLRMQVAAKNIGGTEATGVFVQIFGQSWEVRNSGSVDQTNNGRTPIWKSLGAMSPPDQTLDLPGTQQFLDLEVTATDVISSSVPYSWNSRLFYKYSTTSGALVNVMTDQEARRLNEQQTLERSSVTTFNSGGPLQVEVRTNQPFVVRRDTATVPIVVEISNVGGGTVFSNDVESSIEGYSDIGFDERNKINLVPTKPAGSALTCSNFEPTLRGGTATVSCELSINRDDIAPQRDVEIQMRADYGYFVEQGTSVTVTESFGSDEPLDDGNQDQQQDDDGAPPGPPADQ